MITFGPVDPVGLGALAIAVAIFAYALGYQVGRSQGDEEGFRRGQDSVIIGPEPVVRTPNDWGAWDGTAPDCPDGARPWTGGDHDGAAAYARAAFPNFGYPSGDAFRRAGRSILHTLGYPARCVTVRWHDPFGGRGPR